MYVSCGIASEQKPRKPSQVTRRETAAHMNDRPASWSDPRVIKLGTIFKPLASDIFAPK